MNNPRLADQIPTRPTLDRMWRFIEMRTVRKSPKRIREIIVIGMLALTIVGTGATAYAALSDVGENPDQLALDQYDASHDDDVVTYAKNNEISLASAVAEVNFQETQSGPIGAEATSAAGDRFIGAEFERDDTWYGVVVEVTSGAEIPALTALRARYADHLRIEYSGALSYKEVAMVSKKYIGVWKAKYPEITGNSDAGGVIHLLLIPGEASDLEIIDFVHNNGGEGIEVDIMHKF